MSKSDKVIDLKILTPFRNEFKGKVKRIEIPTSAGRIGILPGHLPVISLVTPGKVSILDSSDNQIEIDILGKGFIRFNKDSCVITTEEDSQHKVA